MAPASTVMTEKGQLQAHLDRADAQADTPSLSPSQPSYQDHEETPTTPTSPITSPGSGAPVPLNAEPSLFGHETSASNVPPSIALPPYSGPSSSSQVNLPRRPMPRGPQQYPGLPKLDYRLYSPPLFELSDDCTTIKSRAPYLSSGVAALASLIRAQSTVPPKPQIFIQGTRGRKIDFAVKLNLMSLLVPDDPRLRMDYIRCVGQGEMAYRGGTKPDAASGDGERGLEEWCRVFIEDQSVVKVFVLERQVANMNIEWLEGQIRSLVAATAYKGVVTVQFPVTHAKVIVQSPDRVNKFFTSVTTLFSGKSTYEVVKSVWPFATHKAGDPARRCIVQSEETWWKEWKDPIKYAIATKRKGWVTNEDKLEAIMEGVGKGLSTVDWGSEYD